MVEIYNNVLGKWKKMSSTNVMTALRATGGVKDVTRIDENTYRIYVPGAHPDSRSTMLRNPSKKLRGYIMRGST